MDTGVSQELGAHPADAGEAGGVLFALMGDVVLVMCENAGGAPARGLRPFRDGSPIAGPSSATIVRTHDGAARVFVAFRRPSGEEHGVLSLQAPAVDGVRQIALGPLVACAFDPRAALAGLDAPARVRVARFLIELPQTVFPQLGGPSYAEFCRQVLRGCGAIVTQLKVVVNASSNHLFCEGRIPASFEAPIAASVVGPDRVAAVQFAPLVGRVSGNQRSVHAMLNPADVLQPDALTILFAQSAIAVAKIVAPPRPRGLLEWLEGDRKIPSALRDYVMSCLAQRAPVDAAAAAALTESALFKPMPRRRVVAPDRPLGAAVELAVGCGDGLFVSGWIRDPYGVVGSLSAVGPNGVRRPIDIQTLRFARPDIEAKYAKTPYRLANPRIGFAAFVRGRSALGMQHSFQIELRSGARVDLTAPPMPPDPAEACNAVLRAIPIDALTQPVIANVIAPAVAPLHRLHLAQRTQPHCIDLGSPPREARASIIVPLYRNLDFLRFQVASFAIDPELRDVELIYVLDSPEQREIVEHLLRGLHGLYALPLRLVVMNRNFGYAAANNAGASHASGEALVLLNSDVIPAAPGWLGRLLAPLARDGASGAGAVGAKLLFDDGSLQHAGLHFRRDAQGRWINDHYFKGMPRDFAPAARARSVPAVTGAAIALPRALFADIGGITEDYIIGDYEDSDLCLKIREKGLEIAYAPDAELFHFERKSIAAHAGYMRGVASEYNNWLHGQRWNVAIERLMDGFARAGSSLQPAAHPAEAA